MSSIRTNSVRRIAADHFEPDTDNDPQAQRRLRGQLEQIDYTAYAANREVLGQTLSHADAAIFQRMAVAASLARAQWIKEALSLSEVGSISPLRIQRLAELRSAFEELAEAYEGLRRMVERGYLPYRGGPNG